jgi:hypothetical protein
MDADTAPGRREWIGLGLSTPLLGLDLSVLHTQMND